MAILDYSAGLNNAPNAIGNMLGTAGQMQGLQAQRQNMTFQQQNQEEGQAQRLAQQQQQAQAQQQEQAARQQGAELLKSGTPQEIARFMITNKNVAKDFINAANFQDKLAEESRVDFAKGIVSDQVDPEQAYIERIETVELNGGDASGLRATLEAGPEAMKSTAEKDLSMLASESMINYKEAMGIDQEKPMTKYESESVSIRKEQNKLRAMEVARKTSEGEVRKAKLDEDIKAQNQKIKEQERKRDEQEAEKALVFKSVVDSGGDAVRLVQEIRNHPGLPGLIGMKNHNLLYGLKSKPLAGSQEAAALALISTLEAQTFLTAIAKAKEMGMSGSLSDAEGTKLGASINSLNVDQSEEQFFVSLDEIEMKINRQVTNAEDQEGIRLKRNKKYSTSDSQAIDVTNFNPQQQQAIEAARAAGYSEEEIQQSLSKRGF